MGSIELAVSSDEPSVPYRICSQARKLVRMNAQ